LYPAKAAVAARSFPVLQSNKGVVAGRPVRGRMDSSYMLLSFSGLMDLGIKWTGPINDCNYTVDCFIMRRGQGGDWYNLGIIYRFMMVFGGGLCALGARVPVSFLLSLTAD